MFDRYFARCRHVMHRVMRRSRRMARLVWLGRAAWSRYPLFLCGALLVGLISVGFAIAANHVDRWRLEWVGTSPLLIFVTAPLGLALASWLTLRFFPGSQGSGIPQTIAAVEADSALRQRLLSLRVAAGKIGLTLLGLGCGASVGREGPSVQIGASIMLALGRFQAFSTPAMQRGLILAGGAAGVAAAFNAPLAGVMFAIEEMSRAFERRTMGIVVIAVVLAGMVSLALLGNYAYFGQSSPEFHMLRDWPAVLLCGVAGGVLGGLFSKALLLFAQSMPARFATFRGNNPALFAALCGLALAVVGLASAHTIYGTGYHEARAILAGETIPASFGILKLLATVISYLSGIPGGIFAPSLAVGAGLGQNIASLLPEISFSAIVILGMVSYFAGVVQAPLTAFVIVMEMNRNPDMALPLMACALIGHSVSRLVCPTALYAGLARGFRA